MVDEETDNKTVGGDPRECFQFAAYVVVIKVSDDAITRISE
jgi:hypothetical protein